MSQAPPLRSFARKPWRLCFVTRHWGEWLARKRQKLPQTGVAGTRDSGKLCPCQGDAAQLFRKLRGNQQTVVLASNRVCIK